ncbi:MAG: T9SS type A sorting domain-containing protein [bacterium]|nr:T9SS type A sorting domain-containing protein [bacterium]
MRGKLLLLALVTGFAGVTLAFAGDGKDGEDVLRKSGPRSPVASYPLPFSLTADNPRTSPPISTGYYFVDSDDEAPDFWRPDPTTFVDTLTEPGTWRRIVSGPKQIPGGYWTSPVDNTYGGFAYFRNPGNNQDSADDAYAGPISIGFPFYFNGVRYDSFFVSTNGLIALSNRRYFYEYDNYGFPTVRTRLETQPGVFSVYDPMSDDTRTRIIGATDINDTQLDNWGSLMVADGNAPTTSTRGIRTKTNSMLDEASLNATGAWTASSRPPLIAFAWDDLQVSVYNSNDNAVDDFSRVYYKRSPANDKLIIYYVNLTPIGTKRAVVGNVTHDVTFVKDNRPGVGEHYRFSGQVTLNRNDSSVTIQYEKFFGIAPRTALQPHGAVVWMRCNSTVGVTGPARRLNWAGFPSVMPTNTILDYSAVKYTQSTEYLFNILTHPMGSLRAISNRNDDQTVPKDFLSIRFKQYKNFLRVINVFYRVRPLNNNAPLDFSQVVPTNQANNYELLAGELRLGAIQPVAIVQNLTNDVQGPNGVNYTRQGINFKVRFRIMNEATGKIVYNTSKSVTDAALRDSTLSGIQRSDINGANRPYQPTNTFVTPYEFIKVTFPPFEPNEAIDDQIGRLITSVIVEPKDSVNQPLGDQWPFDDTTGLRLFVMRRLESFNDDVREFHLVGGAAMPSVLKWVNIEADVVDGDEVTNNPVPPRGEFQAANSAIFSLKSPVIRMNRVTLGTLDIPPFGQYGGDELRSFPVNLNRKKNAVLSISYQRAGKLTNINRGFSDNRLIGPEHRVDATVTAINSPRIIRNPDELWVEFAKPSSDGLNGITNIATWVLDPQNLAGNYAQPFRIWGGGGYLRGFDITNKNQQLNNGVLAPLGGQRIDFFDDGKDAEYFKITIPIPDTVISWVNEGARNFRFRLKARCLNNSTPPYPADDEDNFYIDNVKILYPDEVTDVEFSNIQLVWPYTLAPASQATRVPIRVKLSNNTHIAAPAFSVRIQIKPDGNESQQIYCRTITVPTLAGNREVLLPFPDANFRTTTPGRYKVTGRIFFPGNDLDTLNDSTFTMFTMTFGPSFAYEINPLNPTNDVPKLQFSGITGKGLDHRGYAYGGSNATWINLAGPGAQYVGQIYGYGPKGMPFDAEFGTDGGNASGQLAMRFTLYSQDTAYGYQAFWAELNQDILNISFSLYKDQGGIPGERIANSTIVRRRGEDETDNEVEPVFGKYATYLLASPVVLAPGEYWASVSQMGLEGYELGASESRMGLVTTFYSDIPAPGVGNRSLLIDKNFRTRARNGALLNDNRFAFEVTRFSGDWIQMTPSIGNPGYAHLDGMGNIVQGYYVYPTFTRGSWIPLLRPYFGARSYSTPPLFVPCVVPVELTFFDGRARSAGVDLFWETASEKNNTGFHIERRVVEQASDLTSAAGLSCQDGSNSKEMPWATIGWQAGAGNTTQTSNYKFFDADVKTGTSYEYRLRQVDVDNSENFSNVINVVVSNGDVALDDNYPNPTNGQTTIRFNVPNRTHVKLEIFDLMGNVLTTLYNQQVSGTTNSYAIEWDGRDAGGVEVTSGSYMYKLTADGVVLSKTLTVVR